MPLGGDAGLVGEPGHLGPAGLQLVDQRGPLVALRGCRSMPDADQHRERPPRSRRSAAVAARPTGSPSAQPARPAAGSGAARPTATRRGRGTTGHEGERAEREQQERRPTSTARPPRRTAASSTAGTTRPACRSRSRSRRAGAGRRPVPGAITARRRSPGRPPAGDGRAAGSRTPATAATHREVDRPRAGSAGARPRPRVTAGRSRIRRGGPPAERHQAQHQSDHTPGAEHQRDPAVLPRSRPTSCDARLVRQEHRAEALRHPLEREERPIGDQRGRQLGDRV